MTVIKRLSLKGFKSFAKPIDIIFGNGFNCCLGPNGSGKCLKGNSLVQLADGSLKTIKEIVELNIEKNFTKEIDDGHIAYGGDTEIICLNTETLKAVAKPVLAFVKRKSPENLVRIRTRSGRQITTTEYHPLFILNNDKIQSVNAEHLDVGTKIAVPRKININPKTKIFYELIDLIDAKDGIYVQYNEKFSEILFELKEKESVEWKKIAKNIDVSYNTIKGILDKQAVNFAHLIKILRFAKLDNDQIIEFIPEVKAKNKSKKYKFPWQNNPQFARLLGYLIAEGRISKTSNHVWFTNGTEEIVKDYVNIAKTLFNTTMLVKEYKPNCWDCIIFSGPLIRILEKFGMSTKGTAGKTITNLFLKHSSDEELREFLNGLYSGDGYVSKNSIELTTKSKKLATAFEAILTRLGINHSSKYVIKVATNSGYGGMYRAINITGVTNFKKFSNIKLIHPEKNKRLNNLIKLEANPNVDLIEINDLIKQTAKELKINIKSNKKMFPRLDSYYYNQCTPSRYGINKLINELFIPSAQNEGLTSQSLLHLNTISTSDIFWDEIVEIEAIEHNEEWVYDLCVDKHHNFVANNFFVHNSNIMDAMCFVLGKTSAKSLRAEKSANLIYNGGKKGTPAKEAECSIVFDNSNKRFPIDSEELVITRKVKKSGNSVYKINNEVRTRQQMLDMLRAANIEPDGHNIILQGDIARFMEMKPVERRELVEEIAGISVWEDKKQKAMNELGRVEERLKEAGIMLAEREKYLKELKKDRNQALKYKEFEKNVRDNKATWLNLRIKDKEAKKQEVESRINKQNQELDKIKKKITEIGQTIDKKKDEIQKLDGEMNIRGDEERRKLNTEMMGLRDAVARDEERLNTCKTEIQKLTERINRLRKEMQDHDKKIDELDLQKEGLNKKIKELTGEEQKIQSEINNFKAKHGIKDSSFDTKLDDLENAIDTKQGELLKEQEEKQTLVAKKTQLELQIKTSDEKLNEFLNLKKEDQKKLTKLKESRQEFGKIVKELSQIEEKDSEYNSKLANLRQKLGKVSEELAKLNARQTSIQEFAAVDPAIRRILELGKGIHGTVSDLGEVNSKYSLALEIAAGSRAKSIVVDTDETAAKCIQYLKEHKLGVVTFLPLNKIKPTPQNPRVQDLAIKKGVVGLAVDLVSYDHKFKNIFSYVFGNTLVVQDINTARRIGVGNARMVTLEGDLVDQRGAMVGGYRRRRTGAFKEKQLNASINQLNREETTLRRQIDELGNIQLGNANSLWELKERKALLEAEITNLERNIGFSGDVDGFKKGKENLTNQVNAIIEQIKESQSKISTYNEEVQQLKQQRNQLREKLKQPEIEEALNKLDERKQKVSSNLMEAKLEIKKIDELINAHHKAEKQKLQEIIKNHEKEQTSFEEEIKKLREGLTVKKSTLQHKESTERKFYTEFQSLYAKRNKIAEFVQKQENQLIREEEQVKLVEDKLNRASLDKAKVSAELAGLQEEFKEYADAKIRRNIPEAQLIYQIKRFDSLMKDMGNVNLRALEVYDEVNKKYQEILEKKEGLRSEKEDVLTMMKEIDSKKQYNFMKTFKVLHENFKQCFSQLSTKGEAFLELENKKNVFEGGVEIKVKIIGNRYLDIKGLSGGEKTLAALAFIFAIQEFNPASFYLMDEVDAALDKRNSELLSKLIQKYAEKAQYIVISHNDHIITEAEQIYGVSMQDGISKILSLKV